MLSPDIRINSASAETSRTSVDFNNSDPAPDRILHVNSEPNLLNHDLLSPTNTRTSLRFVNRKPPPKALHDPASDDTTSPSFENRGLNKRDHALPTPFLFQSPRFPRFRHSASSRGGTPNLHGGEGTPRHDAGSHLHHRRSSRQMFVDALDYALDTTLETLSLRQRIKHFTWTWFTMTMATGQLASVIYQVPFKFKGQYEIGCTIFIFNMVLFLFNIAMITARFRMYPHTFRASFLHPTESLFIPAGVVSIGTVMMNITQYGTDTGRTGVWLSQVMTVLFWVYGGFALCFTVCIYLIMWSTQCFTISQMTPVWIFPAYPLLVIGPHAGMLASRATASNALEIIVGGFAFQGAGFMLATMVYAAFLYRLMTNKLPKESLRPGMFISVGPSGFSIAAVINMGQQIRRVIPDDFMGVGEIAGTITMVAANWFGIWLWGLAIFFFLVSVGANLWCLTSGKMVFAMNWYSYVFPNTGLIAATFAVAKALNGNRPINILGCVLTGILVCVWLFVFGMMIRAVVLKQILWPQKQEDRDEGGFSMKRAEDEHRAKHHEDDDDDDDGGKSEKSASAKGENISGSGRQVEDGSKDVERNVGGDGLGISHRGQTPQSRLGSRDDGGGTAQARTEKW